MELEKAIDEVMKDVGEEGLSENTFLTRVYNKYCTGDGQIWLAFDASGRYTRQNGRIYKK